jgi:hypothetical protein
MTTYGSLIGMTTGAARYHNVLAEVACTIVILEEAAEVLEAHMVTTLHKNVQHVILSATPIIVPSLPHNISLIINKTIQTLRLTYPEVNRDFSLNTVHHARCVLHGIRRKKRREVKVPREVNHG